MQEPIRNRKIKKLMKSKCDLAILSNKILPDEKNEKKMSVEDQQKRYEELAEKFVLLDVPMIVDRSADEERMMQKQSGARFTRQFSRRQTVQILLQKTR